MSNSEQLSASEKFKATAKKAVELLMKAWQPILDAMKRLFEKFKQSVRMYVEHEKEYERTNPYYQRFSGQRKKGGRFNPRLGGTSKIARSFRPT